MKHWTLDQGIKNYDNIIVIYTILCYYIGIIKNQ